MSKCDVIVDLINGVSCEAPGRWQSPQLPGPAGERTRCNDHKQPGDELTQAEKDADMEALAGLY